MFEEVARVRRAQHAPFAAAIGHAGARPGQDDQGGSEIQSRRESGHASLLAKPGERNRMGTTVFYPIGSPSSSSKPFPRRSIAFMGLLAQIRLLALDRAAIHQQSKIVVGRERLHRART
jgi:hypothetical protein